MHDFDMTVTLLNGDEVEALVEYEAVPGYRGTRLQPPEGPSADDVRVSVDGEDVEKDLATGELDRVLDAVNDRLAEALEGEADDRADHILMERLGK